MLFFVSYHPLIEISSDLKYWSKEISPIFADTCWALQRSKEIVLSNGIDIVVSWGTILLYEKLSSIIEMFIFVWALLSIENIEGVSISRGIIIGSLFFLIDQNLNYLIVQD